MNPLTCRPHAAGLALAADGGLPEEGLLRLLPREDALRLVHGFFSLRRSA